MNDAMYAAKSETLRGALHTCRGWNLQLIEHFCVSRAFQPVIHVPSASVKHADFEKGLQGRAPRTPTLVQQAAVHGQTRKSNRPNGAVPLGLFWPLLNLVNVRTLPNKCFGGFKRYICTDCSMVGKSQHSSSGRWLDVQPPG